MNSFFMVRHRHRSLALSASLVLLSGWASAQTPPQASLDRFGGVNPIARTLRLSAVQAMLDAGADPNLRDPHTGATLLHYAALYDKPALIELLLAHRANVNAQIDVRGTETGATPLLYTVVQNELPLTKLLVAHGADVRSTYRSGRTALHIAASGGMTDMARFLLRNGADANARDRRGFSPLDEAVLSGSPEVTSLLLEAGARIDDVQPGTGATPLNEAARQGQDAVLELLLTHNADAAIEDKAGLSPIENAIRFGHTETARLMLQSLGPELSKDSLARFLGEAVGKGEPDAVKMLLSSGADAAAYLPSGSTALGLAALKGQDAIVELLIEKGADVNGRNRDGTMPLYDAALSGHLKTVAILLARGAEIDAREQQSGTTALYAAASFGHQDVAALLLESGADPDIRSTEGKSPLDAALNNGNVEIASKIRQYAGQNRGKKF